MADGYLIVQDIERGLGEGQRRGIKRWGWFAIVTLVVSLTWLITEHRPGWWALGIWLYLAIDCTLITYYYNLAVYLRNMVHLADQVIVEQQSMIAEQPLAVEPSHELSAQELFDMARARLN